MDLRESKILITGGSLGIGRATARMLVDAGAKVVITGRSKERLAIAAVKTGAHSVVADVSTEAGIEKTYSEAVAYLGGLDVLINNAGIGVFENLKDLELKDFDHVFGTNVFGLALLSQKAAQTFIDQKSGNIINIASTAASKGFAGGTVYAASKFALRGMTQCWQAELRPHNIRVMLVNPSEVATAFGNPDRVEREAAANKLRSEEIAHSIKSILEMDDRGFIPEMTVWATNPFS